MPAAVCRLQDSSVWYRRPRFLQACQSARRRGGQLNYRSLFRNNRTDSRVRNGGLWRVFVGDYGEFVLVTMASFCWRARRSPRRSYLRLRVVHSVFPHPITDRFVPQTSVARRGFYLACIELPLYSRILSRRRPLAYTCLDLPMFPKQA